LRRRPTCACAATAPEAASLRAPWCAPSFTAGSKSKETRKGRRWPSGEAPNAAGNRSFSAREGGFEWRREAFLVYFYKQDFDQVVEVYRRSRLYRGKGVRPECLGRIFEKAVRQVTDTYERRDVEECKRRGHPPRGPSEVWIFHFPEHIRRAAISG
jgi:hypothetical protein